MTMFQKERHLIVWVETLVKKSVCSALLGFNCPNDCQYGRKLHFKGKHKTALWHPFSHTLQIYYTYLCNRSITMNNLWNGMKGFNKCKHLLKIHVSFVRCDIVSIQSAGKRYVNSQTERQAIADVHVYVRT